jgi:hypothetical protein
MAPLAVTSPVMVANLDRFRNMTALTGEIDEVVSPYAVSKFDAFFRMFTNEFDTASHRRDVLRLSQAAESGLFSRNSLIAETENTGDGRLASPLLTPEHALNEQRRSPGRSRPFQHHNICVGLGSFRHSGLQKRSS